MQPAATQGAVYAFNEMHLRHVVTIAQDFAFGWLVVGGFAASFKKLGGTIDKMIWVPNTTVDFSPYVSQIPRNTEGVFAELSSETAVRLHARLQTVRTQGQDSGPLLGRGLRQGAAAGGGAPTSRTACSRLGQVKFG